mmetsp:Transcript_36405/g.74718  ORF Transcript_36405/g.74718 Transcript_36405/m.74718 type:complete len:260 (+) Transcript_36405:153-932(+)|eukprot:CAMPEP_0181291576 /NCGR_PEP_ID=MMETSP1101-20121128/2041_1 /TAXON_ID=46948 /ORGANISM="Rhodomonas abbreviata, Strain Caron Lab Isolate" /LENGTH=259 /DNA_ID=CAMNT_0023395977 /DNA_START=151 /DNA_END=926 /DNA_ORIENTATION=+
MKSAVLLRAASTLLLTVIVLICVPNLLSSRSNGRNSSIAASSHGANPTQLEAYPDGRDMAALSYDGASRQKMNTLHQLAVAAVENQKLKSTPAMSSSERWSSHVSSADDPGAALKELQGNAASGSSESKQLSQARENIAAVMQQSDADMALRKEVLKAARTNDGTGNSWNSLLSRQIGPHSLAMASDWLRTEEATSTSKNKKSVFARAQLAAALSQVGGHFDGASSEGREELSHARRPDKEMSYESSILHRVMSKTLGG